MAEYVLKFFGEGHWVERLCDHSAGALSPVVPEGASLSVADWGWAGEAAFLPFWREASLVVFGYRRPSAAWLSSFGVWGACRAWSIAS